MRRTLVSVAFGVAAIACSGASSGNPSSTTTGGGGLNIPPGYVGNFDAGTCTPAPGYAGNSEHVGAFCSEGGGQCTLYGGNFLCAADVDPNEGDDFFCILPCMADSDCAENACCHGDTLTGTNLRACVPLLCVTDGGTCPAGI